MASLIALRIRKLRIHLALWLAPTADPPVMRRKIGFLQETVPVSDEDPEADAIGSDWVDAEENDYFEECRNSGKS